MNPGRELIPLPMHLVRTAVFHELQETEPILARPEDKVWGVVIVHEN